MKLQHQFDVPADLATTWHIFNDLEQVVPCFPGATLTSVEGEDFEGSVRLKLGPISLTYNGKGRFVTRDEEAGTVVMEAQGVDRRGNGTAGITVTASLTEADGGGTLIDVESEVSISGKPAQFGRGLIQRVSDRMLGQFLDCMKEKMASA
ncbi:MAG TPA: SRPBCC family protein [Beutenbergiaceae bacterium]|nr:SRPBCC family protein [Beutenbergiaceae bacterium]